MDSKTVSKKGAVILGVSPMIAAVGLKENPNLWVVAALAFVLTVYICVQGYLDLQVMTSEKSIKELRE